MAKKKVSGAVRAEDEGALAMRLMAMIDQRRRQEQDAVEDEPLRVTWANWVRKVVSRHISEEGARADRKAIKVHERFILDLPFEFEGRTICFGDIPGLKTSLLMGQAWRSELQLQRKWKRGTPTNERARVGPDGKWNRGNGESLSPTYRDRMIATLQALITQRYGRGRNPLHGLAREGDAGRARQGFFKNEAHLQEWLQYSCLQYQRIAPVCVSGGACRLTEARLLMEHEVTWDPATRLIYLPNGRVKNREGKKFSISSKCYATLEALRGSSPVCTYANCEVRRNPKLAPEHWAEHRHLFALQSASDGRAPSDSTVSDWARAASARWEEAAGAAARLGPKKERPSTHHLRHTGGTWNAFRSNGNVMKVMREGGWQTLRIATNYVHQGEEMLAEAAAQEDMTMAEALARRLAELQGDKPAPAPKAPPRTPRRPRNVR